MVALKVWHYPVDTIIKQTPAHERAAIKDGIDAVTELGFFLMEGGDICLTDRGEMLFQGLFEACRMSEIERLDLTKTHPGFTAILTAIQQDSRLTPPKYASAPAGIGESPTIHSITSHPNNIPGFEPLTFWNKVFLAIFAIWMLLGAMKLIFRY